MEELNDIQFQILDALYFVEPFSALLQEVDAPEAVIKDELRILIDRDWVQVMEFVEEKGDYLRTAIYDADNMQQYAFLATKKGLLVHNGY
ncbi:MAG: hypothetical protein D6730_09050 [Bacteroidetes bacterium]|nr:MAG: hypothetical protein D6730_09050 [Bacteroidota bacterium]